MDINKSKRVAGQIGPDVLVIGAMRAGTTTLYDLMLESGLISVPRMKETDFFLAGKFKRGLKWFNTQFDDLEKPLCDVSPNYTKRHVFSGVAERIHNTNPDAALIYLVRDPVKRVISEYHHLTAMGTDLPPPAQLLDHKVGREIIKCSHYAYQLEPYLDLWPQDKIFVIDFEDLIEQQNMILNPVLEHLGLPIMSEKMQNVRANSSKQLLQVPKWWGPIRNTPLVEWMRSKMPRSTVAKAKSLVFQSAGKADQLIEFDTAAIERIADAVADDAAAFEKLTGRKFKGWTV